mmetsp:Transcript_10721/g.32821  ORF Transcript_10721/g.32821 Transcript_10721/m.32821 type:complete len:328 (-) Transcript_10721:144-1127(-)
MAFVSTGLGTLSSRTAAWPRCPSVRRGTTTVAVARNVRARTRSDDELVGGPTKATWEHSQGSSRFPENWAQAMDDAGAAVTEALQKGEDRLLVELSPPVRPMEFLETLVKPLIMKNMKIKIYFDSINEMMDAAPDLSEHLKEHVTISFLGNRDEMGESDIAFVFQPNNVNGNPKKIEDVEWIHYRLGWTEPRPVVLVNPKLMSLGSGPDAVGNVRRPMFIEDYSYAYFLDANVFHDEHIHGALLCNFPRKWEMYVFKSAGGFRLIAQYRAKPNADKVLVQFLWRSDMAKNTRGLDRTLERTVRRSTNKSTASRKKAPKPKNVEVSGQ